MSRFILYGTSACHLCEIAEQMLEAELGVETKGKLDKVDISESDVLFERYGVRIPVLHHPDGRELGWPFDSSELAIFLRS